MDYEVFDLQEYWGREEEFFPILDANEKARAERFRNFPSLRRNYILAHAILRFEIAKYLSINPVAISYLYGPFGETPSGIGRNALQYVPYKE